MENVEWRRQYFTRASELIGYVETRREPISLLKGFGAELFGTTLVILVWLATAASIGRSDESSAALSLTVGFIVAAMLWVTDFVSGGHLNPSVTFGYLFSGQINVLKAAVFIVAQSLGGIFGSGILIGLTATNVSKYGAGFNATITIPNTDINVGQALGVEIVAAAVIVLVALSVKDENRQEVHTSGPVAVGFSMAACHFAFMFSTGPGLNPARSFGPAVWSGTWKQHWIYWVGSLLGALIAALLHLTIFRAPPPTIMEVESLNQTDKQFPEMREETSFVEVPITPEVPEDRKQMSTDEIEEIVGIVDFPSQLEEERPTGTEGKTHRNTSRNESELIV